MIEYEDNGKGKYQSITSSIDLTGYESMFGCRVTAHAYGEDKEEAADALQWEGIAKGWHEESQRLKRKLYDEHGCDVNACEAHWKLYREENQWLRDIVDGQRTALEDIQRETYAEYDGTTEEANASCVNKCRKIARNALALTATNTEEKE